MFNATFNNISVKLWQSVLLVEETGENHRSVCRKSLTNFITGEYHQTNIKNTRWFQTLCSNEIWLV